MKPRKKFDLRSPETAALKRRIEQGAFLTEGTMVACPLGFPGISVPIAGDESHITALDIAPDGAIYGGTSGRQTHLFTANFHGPAGIVFDLGTVPGADRCAAIGCGRNGFFACVNGPTSGRVIRGDFTDISQDFIQEWGLSRTPLQDLGEPVPGERIIHARCDASRERAVIATEHHLVVLDLASGKMRQVGRLEGSGRLAAGPGNTVLGLDEDALWSWDVEAEKLTRRAIALPKGDWRGASFASGQDPTCVILYAADASGNLYAMGPDRRFGERLGRTPVAPVGPMAVTLDGRLFGACGSGIARMFVWRPGSTSVEDMGVAVSVLGHRRYGYAFGDAVTGRDGQILLGEDDDFGHLWIYFPSVPAKAHG